jgi:hypothetical protein
MAEAAQWAEAVPQEETAAPASLLSVQLHFEHWSCMRGSGQAMSCEISEGDGLVEIKLTPAVESNALKVVSEFGRIEAIGMVGDALRSGSLGKDLREKIAQSLVSALQAGADFKIVLLPAARNNATLQSAKFQDSGTGNLYAVLGGQIRLSNEQVDLLASQLKETLSAQGNPPQ